jgi:hypothetical protein
LFSTALEFTCANTPSQSQESQSAFKLTNNSRKNMENLQQKYF